MSRLLIFVVFLASFVFGCGPSGDDGSCAVVANGDGTYAMTCPDGSSVVFSDGAHGDDGNSCTVTDNEDGTYTMACTDGTHVDFNDGTDGEDGGSCTVVDNLDGTCTVSCPDGSSAVISAGANGTDGTDGEDGEDGSSCTVIDNGWNTFTMKCPDGTTASWGDIVEEMIRIPAGEFWMGCNTLVDSNCVSHESPYHAVTLSEFYIDRTEVTQSDYHECVTDGVCTEPACSFAPDTVPDYPVVCVTWPQARTYCEWAGKRLPSEAEWEKAARGSDGRVYPWGNSAPSCDNAVCRLPDTECATTGPGSVCSKSPVGDSPYGLCDMAGNVDEHVWDWYDANYYAVSPAADPTGPVSGEGHIIRGGSYAFTANALRSSSRLWLKESQYFDHIGFRCAWNSD